MDRSRTWTRICLKRSEGKVHKNKQKLKIEKGWWWIELGGGLNLPQQWGDLEKQGSNAGEIKRKLVTSANAGLEHISPTE